MRIPALLLLAVAPLSIGSIGLFAVGCVDDSKTAPDPPTTPGLQIAPPSTDAAPPPVTPPPPGTDAALPPLDAGPDGASFATGLGPGAVVTKSAKYTLITKTGGSPGGAGVSRTPNHTVVSGAAANAKP